MALVSLAGCGWHLNGQTSLDLTRQGRLGSGTTLPAQCAVGQIFLKSNAPAGANLYTCAAQNLWTVVGLAQGSTASRPANCTFGQIWLATDTGAMTYCSVTGNPGTWSPMLAGPTGATGPAGANGANGAISQIAAAGTALTVRPILNFGAGANCADNSGANRTDCTFSGGGSGSVVLTSGSGAPLSNCAGPSSSNLAVYLDTTNQNEWWCSAANIWKKILSVTGSGPYGVVGGTGTPPGAPSSGSVACYFDSTTNTQICLDSSGNAFTMVKGASSAANQFVTNIDTSGIQHLAQPSFANLSGTASYKTISCQPGLGDGLTAIAAGTYLMSECLNEFGAAWTITAIKCFTDNNGTSTLNVTNSAAGGLLAGPVTCSNTWAAGTPGGTTTLASADWAKFTFVSDGTTKQATFAITGTR
jgi:hypothetical protein